MRRHSDEQQAFRNQSGKPRPSARPEDPPYHRRRVRPLVPGHSGRHLARPNRMGVRGVVQQEHRPVHQLLLPERVDAGQLQGAVHRPQRVGLPEDVRHHVHHRLLHLCDFSDLRALRGILHEPYAFPCAQDFHERCADSWHVPGYHGRHRHLLHLEGLGPVKRHHDYRGVDSRVLRRFRRWLLRDEGLYGHHSDLAGRSRPARRLHPFPGVP